MSHRNPKMSNIEKPSGLVNINEIYIKEEIYSDKTMREEMCVNNEIERINENNARMTFEIRSNNEIDSRVHIKEECTEEYNDSNNIKYTNIIYKDDFTEKLKEEICVKRENEELSNDTDNKIIICETRENVEPDDRIIKRKYDDLPDYNNVQIRTEDDTFNVKNGIILDKIEEPASELNSDADCKVESEYVSMQEIYIDDISLLVNDDLKKEAEGNFEAPQISKIPEESVNINPIEDPTSNDLLKKYQCNLCNKAYTRNDLLKRHFISIHSKERKYQCDICQKQFFRSDQLKNHLVVHTRKKMHRCYVCQKSYSRKYDLKIHIATHTEGKKYRCDICGKTFMRQYGLKVHLEIHTEEKKYHCDICQKSFTRRDTLTSHLSVHNKKKFECDICEKTFIIKDRFTRHLATHTEERNYHCDYCQKSFTRKEHLKYHSTIHNKKKWQCAICLKSFARKDHYESHVAVHNGKKKYLCKFCGRAFSRKEYLLNHSVVHAKKEKLQCSICQKKYYRNKQSPTDSVEKNVVICSEKCSLIQKNFVTKIKTKYDMFFKIN